MLLKIELHVLNIVCFKLGNTSIRTIIYLHTILYNNARKLFLHCDLKSGHTIPPNHSAAVQTNMLKIKRGLTSRPHSQVQNNHTVSCCPFFMSTIVDHNLLKNNDCLRFPLRQKRPVFAFCLQGSHSRSNRSWQFRKCIVNRLCVWHSF